MPNMQKQFKQIPTERTRVNNETLWLPKVDLEYRYNQLELSEETSRQGNFALP